MDATDPPTRPTVLSAVKHAFRQMSDNNLSLIAAGVAFYAMLSLFPALAAVIAVLSLISNPEVVLVQLEELRELLPDDVHDILFAQISSLIYASPDVLGWTGIVSILVALWSARLGVGAMMSSLNRVYGDVQHSALSEFFWVLLLTATLMIVAVVTLMTLVVTPVILAFLQIGRMSEVLLDILRWMTAAGAIYLGVALLYRVGSRGSSYPPRWVTPGAGFALVTWGVLSVAFAYYVANFGAYNEIYGSIGAVIAMLMWLWMSSLVVLIGAALNVGLEAAG